MEIHFQQNEHLKDGETEITLSAKTRSLEIDELIEYLKNYRSMPPAVMPFKSDDHVYLINPDNIILIDVYWKRSKRLYARKSHYPPRGVCTHSLIG